MEPECTTTELHRPQPRYSAIVSVQARPASRVRNRTRGAILAAAASVLARDRAATLPDIAEAAGVGRTTLHRYFPDRESLIEAAVEDSIQAIYQSVAEAALHQGPSMDAMRRAVAAMVAVGDRLMFVFGDPRVLQGYRAPDGVVPPSDPVLDLIERGQAEGAFDRGCEDADSRDLSRHGITATVIRTLENGIHVR